MPSGRYQPQAGIASSRKHPYQRSRRRGEDIQKIRQALEHGTLSLDSSVVARLAEARNNALDHQKTVVTRLGLAGIGVSIGDVLLPSTPMLVAITALTLGIVGTYYWNAFEQADEDVDVDSAPLSDDLPVDAYIDQGFQAWLNHSLAQEVEGITRR